MIFKFLKYKGNENVVHKNFDSNTRDLQCEIVTKDEISMQIKLFSDISDYNYIDFDNTIYKIVKMRQEHNFILCDLEIDVLSTYANIIGGMDVLLSRQRTGNTYINDEKFITTSEHRIQTKKFRTIELILCKRREDDSFLASYQERHHQKTFHHICFSLIRLSL